MKATRAQVASIFGVTPPAVDGWVRRGCPVAEESRGRGRGRGAKFWMPDVVAWYVVNVAPRRVEDGEDGDSTKELNKRLLRAQTEDAELDLAKKRAELMTVSEYHDAVAATFARVGARLKSIAPKLAAAAVGVESLQDGLAQMEPVVHELLQELAEGEDVPLVEEPEAPATADDSGQFELLALGEAVDKGEAAA